MRRLRFSLALSLSVAAAAAPAQPADSGAPASAAAAQAQPAAPTVQLLKVGPARPFKSIAEAARAVAGRAVIEVDAGDYAADVAVWDRGEVTLRAVGGRVRLLAQGAAAEGKAIWVVRAARFSVEGFDFVGVRVASQNGAGIRFEAGHLTVRDCRFLDSENGILAGNDRQAVLEIEDSEFGRNGYGDGQSHNLYVGTIARLRVVGSHFHHARSGHLLKSRAAVNQILYNRLVDGSGGQASYELEFPSGGVSVVIGNLIEQGAQTENPHIVSVGAEGYAWPVNALYLVHNTLVDQRAGGGVFLRVRPGIGALRVLNNVLTGGSGEFAPIGGGEFVGNVRAAPGDFDPASREPYRLRAAAAPAARAADLGEVNGQPLRPVRELASPLGTRPLPAGRLGPGALQPIATTR